MRCGDIAVDRHHPTWRGTDGAYLDPGFKVTLCHDCHELAGDDIRVAQLDRSAGPTVLETLELSLRRVAVFLARFDASSWAPLALGLARWCLDKADGLAGEIARLDHATPSWRTAGLGDA